MDLDRLKTEKGADAANDRKVSPVGFLRDVVTVVVATALLFCLIEFVSGIALVIRYKYTYNPPRTKYLADIAWLSPFFDKDKKEECPGIYQKASQKAKTHSLVSGEDENYGFFIEDSLLGFRFAPDTKICYPYPASVGGATYITNKEGFASIGESDFYYGREKPSGTYRIIALGGSTMWGYGVATPDQNIPARLLNRLRERYPNVKFEVINAGVGGYNTRNELLYLYSELVYYSPDLVITYDGWNDSYINGFMYQGKIERLNALKSPDHNVMDQRMKNDRTLEGTFALFTGTLNETVNENLDWSATHRVLNRFLWHKNSNLFVHRDDMFKSQLSQYDKRGPEIFINNLQMEIMASKLHKFKIGVFLQPILGVGNRKLTAVEDQRVKALISEPYFNIRKSFYADAIPMYEHFKGQYKGDNDVCIADISSALDDVPETVYVDNGHLFPKGNDVMALKIIDELDRCGILQKGSFKP